MEMEMSGWREMTGLVFILVQVSLFIEVFVLWRRKAFLKNTQN